MDEEWIDMLVGDVRRSPAHEDRPAQCVVVLEEADGKRWLPIFIGCHEASSMVLALEGIALRRPLTYAFTASCLARAVPASVRYRWPSWSRRLTTPPLRSRDLWACKASMPDRVTL